MNERIMHIGLLICVVLPLFGVSSYAAGEDQNELPSTTNKIRKEGFVPYCGVYCLYAIMKMAGKNIEFEELVRHEYIGSNKGSSFAELRKAAEDHGLHARTVGKMTSLELIRSGYPIILHVRSGPTIARYDHYELFLGTKAGKAIMFNPPEPIRSVTFAELAPRWDGYGLIVSKEPIGLGGVLAPARKRFVSWTVGLVAVVALVHWAGRFTPADMFKSPRAILGLSVAHGMGLAVLTLLCALLCHFFSDEGLLANSSATTAIQQAHAGDFIPRIGESGVRSRIGNATVLVDARFSGDYKAGHLEGAINIPVDVNEVVRRQITSRVDKGSVVVVYCQSKGCPFAEKVAVRLVEDGFTDVSIYRGGWTDWISKNGKPKEGKS